MADQRVADRRASPGSAPSAGRPGPVRPAARGQRPAGPPRRPAPGALPGGTRNPVTPWSTRSSGPPAAGATTGTPDWRRPPAGSGRTSRAGRCARTRPGWRRCGPAGRRGAGQGTPRTAWPGAAGPRRARRTMTRRTPGSLATPASSSTRFSGASDHVPGEHLAAGRQGPPQRAAVGRRVKPRGPRRGPTATSAPRRARRSRVMIAEDGTRVRSAALWMPRRQRHAAASPGPVSRTHGRIRARRSGTPRSPAGPAGGPRASSRAEKDRARQVHQLRARCRASARRIARLGRPRRTPGYPGSDTGRHPFHRVREGAASLAPGGLGRDDERLMSPRWTRCSATRSTLCATPFTSGAKDSVTIPIRTLTT